MASVLRVPCLLAPVLLLTILPVSQTSVILALVVAVDLAAAAHFLNRPAPRSSAIVTIGDNASLPLLRRTVPELRGRRPLAIIEAQVQWRQAAEFRRRRVPTQRPAQ